MKVVRLDAVAVRAQPAAGETYWGARSWSADRGRSLATYPLASRRRFVYSATIDTTLVRVETSDGVIGWGEAKAPVAPEVTALIIEQLLAPVVIGTRLDEIGATWDRMYAGMRVRGHDSGFFVEALSGVDIALWDAWGQTLSQPVWALVGGRHRESVPVYASGIPGAPTGSGSEGQEAVRAEAQRLRDLGHVATKVAIGTDPATDVASVATVREVFGEGCRVFADAAGQYDVRQALAVGRELQDLGIGFYEMPVPPEGLEDYALLADRLDVPIALDSLSTRFRAIEYLRRGALHVLQPDVCRSGGITEVMRIAVLADAFGAQATPHVSIGSPVHVAASLHCAAAIPNLDVMEYWIGSNPLTRWVHGPGAPVDGQLGVPDGPGLGVSVDEAALPRA